MTVRVRLRAATGDRHDRIDRDLALADRLHDRREVVLVLARFWGFFAGLEPSLDRLLGDAMSGRHRRGDLSADLARLGLATGEIARLPICHAAGELTGEVEALGALYVVEGARLGGRLIAGALRQTDWCPPQGLRFWSELPAAKPWRDLISLLDTLDSDAEARATASACTTFDRLHEWLGAGGALACAQDER